MEIFFVIIKAQENEDQIFDKSISHHLDSFGNLQKNYIHFKWHSLVKLVKRFFSPSIDHSRCYILYLTF